MNSESPSQKQKEPDRSNRPADEQGDQPKPPVPPSSASGISKVQPPPSHPSYKITCEKKRDVWDWIKFAAEIVGIGVVITYTSIAALQWCEMKRANRLTKQALGQAQTQMRISVRPWVGITDEPNAIQTTPIKFDGQGNASIKYRVSVRNYSTYGVQNVMAIGNLVVTEDLNRVRREMDALCGDNFVGHLDMGDVVFPGKQQLLTESGSIFNRSEMGSSKKFEGWFVGCIGYRDQFKFLYHTRFIYWLNDTHGRPIEFDPTPNTQIGGAFVPYFSSID